MCECECESIRENEGKFLRGFFFFKEKRKDVIYCGAHSRPVFPSPTGLVSAGHFFTHTPLVVEFFLKRYLD